MRAGPALWLIRPRRGNYAWTSVIVYAVTALVTIQVGQAAHSFWRRPDAGGPLGQFLAVALVIALLAPVVSTCLVSVRLSHRHRRRLLSTMRLLGASSARIRVVSLVGETATATLGAAIAVAVGVAVLWARQRTGADVHLSGPSLMVGPLTIVLFAALCSAGELKEVLGNPLSARMHWQAASVRSWRLVAGVVLFVGAMVLLKMVGPGWGVVAIACAVAVAVLAVNSTLGLIGPWVVSRLARRRLARVRTASELIAMRDVLESPAAAWRSVSTLGLTCFLLVPVGSMLGYLHLIQSTTPGIGASVLADLEDARAAMAIGVTAAIVLAVVAIGAGQVVAIKEREDLHVALHRIGMSSGQILRARWVAVQLPLFVAVVGSSLVSAVFFWWLLLAGIVSSSTHVAVTVCGIVAAYLSVRLVLVATGPVLRRQLDGGVGVDEELGAARVPSTQERDSR